MRVSVEEFSPFVPEEVQRSVIGVTTACLQEITTRENQFIVNDTVCFRRQRTGRITTCVMNSASYLSRQFQQNLARKEGCAGETRIEDQNIDGFITRRVQATGFRIRDRDELLRVLHRYIQEEGLPDSSVYTLFPMFYGMYTGRGIYDIQHLPGDLRDLFEEVPGEKEFRVGVEFETGNVASSFRAFNKLFVLFQSGHIDAGVFVTCADKNTCATRIWPVANRNGSFQELRQRRFMEQVSLPLISIGFAPDDFDSQAPFLGRNGTLWSPESTGRTDESGRYEICLGEDGEEILKPIWV